MCSSTADAGAVGEGADGKKQIMMSESLLVRYLSPAIMGLERRYSASNIIPGSNRGSSCCRPPRREEGEAGGALSQSQSQFLSRPRPLSPVSLFSSSSSPTPETPQSKSKSSETMTMAMSTSRTTTNTSLHSRYTTTKTIRDNCTFSSSNHTRFPPLLLIPYILLLIVSNQGIVRHVHGQQVWSDPNHSAAGFGQQYASFEELQRLTENPFENNTAVNVTVPLGDNAFLRCKVRNLGERSISWVRRRDWHILTSGKQTFSNDERFHVLHADGSDEWTLQIKFVQKRDNGTYECQVSTGTGIVSYLVHLIVAVPEAFILGNGEYHVEQGSTINLVCVIEKSPKPPEYIFWYHNDRMINYGSSREVKVHNEPGSKTHSRLTIKDAQISDSGNYTCKTAHAEPASTLVYVSQGDQIAAIQKRKAAAAASSTSVTSFSQSQSSAPLKAYLGFTLINFIFLVPFLTQSLSFYHSLSSLPNQGRRHQNHHHQEQKQYYQFHQLH